MSDSRHEHEHEHGHGHPPGGHHVHGSAPGERQGTAGSLRVRSAAIRRVFWITLLLNFVVAIAKGVYSYLSGSITLSADAFHSVLDGSANILALLGIHFSAAPADAEHPYGHRKIEIVAALGIGILLAVSLFEVATAAIEALRGLRPPPNVGWQGFAVVLGTMGINLFVTRYEARKGHELESTLLCADAHHTESDLYASGAVLVSFVGARMGLWWADGVCGLILVVMVAKLAWSIFRENVPSLLDAAVLDPARVRDIGNAVSGVESIHGVRSRGTKWAVSLDLHMKVDGNMKVEDAHRLAHKVEDVLRASLPSLSDVVVHIEPVQEPALAKLSREPGRKSPLQAPGGGRPRGPTGEGTEIPPKGDQKP